MAGAAAVELARPIANPSRVKTRMSCFKLVERPSIHANTRSQPSSSAHSTIVIKVSLVEGARILGASITISLSAVTRARHAETRSPVTISVVVAATPATTNGPSPLAAPSPGARRATKSLIARDVFTRSLRDFISGAKPSRVSFEPTSKTPSRFHTRRGEAGDMLAVAAARVHLLDKALAHLQGRPAAHKVRVPSERTDARRGPTITRTTTTRSSFRLPAHTATPRHTTRHNRHFLLFFSLPSPLGRAKTLFFPVCKKSDYAPSLLFWKVWPSRCCDRACGSCALLLRRFSHPTAPNLEFAAAPDRARL
mmetsp:Transcript_36668/g.89633  ORF Transcript_36668/g.89633 Transcript_36668/m.89633 type:complete len:309 (+) Transcript_36668:1221-2147(+)